MADISFIRTITVIGAGTMGREIVQVALMAGFDKVVLNDVKEEIITEAVKYIKDGLNKIESKGKLKDSLTAELLMTRLMKETELSKAVKDADFIIEAVPEIMDLKQELFKNVGHLSPSHAILATNTSTMSITEIGKFSGRSDKMIGMHFFIPIPILRLIEVIKGKDTSQETMDITAAVGERLPSLKGKRFIARIEKESPGFIVNRLTIASNAYLNWLLDFAMEHRIPFEEIDADVSEFGLGPCAKLDYLGLDTIFNVLTYFSNVISKDFTPGKALTKLVKEGHLGRKTGKGFCEWTKEGTPIVNLTKKAGLFNTELFYAMQLNEGCRLLEEGIVKSYKTIDDTMLAGMDMPGPFGAGKRNYQKWSELLEDFVKKSGKNYFMPCKLMKSGGFLKMRK